MGLRNLAYVCGPCKAWRWDVFKSRSGCHNRASVLVPPKKIITYLDEDKKCPKPSKQAFNTPPKLFKKGLPLHASYFLNFALSGINCGLPCASLRYWDIRQPLLLRPRLRLRLHFTQRKFGEILLHTWCPKNNSRETALIYWAFCLETSMEVSWPWLAFFGSKRTALFISRQQAESNFE